MLFDSAKTNAQPIRLLIVLCLLSVMPGCFAFRKNAFDEGLMNSRSITYQGIHADQSGDSDKAEKLLANAVQACPRDEKARLRYAQILARRGSVDEAISHMTAAFQMSGKDPLIAMELAELYLQKDDLQTAEKAIDFVLNQNRKIARAWELKADLEKKRDHPSEALRHYLRAATIAGDDQTVHEKIGQLYFELGQFERALATYDVLLESYSEDAQPETIVLAKSRVMQELNRPFEAKALLASVANRKNASPAAIAQYGQALAQTGDVVTATLVLQSGLQNHPNNVRLASALKEVKSDSQPLSMIR